MSENKDKKIAESGSGLRYDSAMWRRLAAGGDWDGTWPVVDRDGEITGEVIDSQDDYLNVEDDAMIHVDEARAGGWTIDRDAGTAKPPKPVIVEFAVANETIRDGAGIDEFAGLEHPYMAEACAAYRAAAVAALADDRRARRLVADRPQGQRILHSAWAGTYWKYSSGAIGTMGDLTEAEKAAVSEADDAGRAAARKVIAEDETPQVSRHQIAAMQDEAVAAGDDAMSAICAAALDGDPVAEAEVARCLREAAAQHDD